MYVINIILVSIYKNNKGIKSLILIYGIIYCKIFQHQIYIYTYNQHPSYKYIGCFNNLN